MRILSWPPLPLVQQLLEQGLRFLTTPSVRGEMSNSVEDVVANWERMGWFEVRPIKRDRVKELRNTSRRPVPGPSDMGLIALAWTESAPLLTHDAPAQHFAADRSVGILVVDLVDVMALAAHQGLVALSDLSVAWGGLPHPSWQEPAGWRGSVLATVEGRAEMDTVMVRLVNGLT
ncbi:hypothetical protein L6R53_12310 [Myxococcota bacterium]|nr:hypothetical protein [Myxococcota bacterium]